MIGKTILHYKILAKLGEGGMGVVYKAEDTKLERIVAIKFLPRQIAANSEERERFQIEAKAAASLNHPNIATIHAIEEADDELFIVMEYIEGQELKDIVGAGFKPAPTLTVDEITDYAGQITAGLQAAHKKGVTHRDIKSSNIMITDEDQVKIMDFGLAKVRGGVKFTKVGTTLGTAAYMSPEQARGEEADERADIWSFGVVLYEMLTGKMPFPGDYEQAVMYAIMNEDPELVSESREDIPLDLENIVNRCLQKEAKARYQNTEDLQADLQALQDGQTSRVSSAVGATGRSPLPKRTSLYGGIAVLILLSFTGYFFLGRQTAATERVPIAVVDFVNQTNEPELDGLSGMLITALEQSRRLKVFSRARMYDEFKQMNRPDLQFVDEATGRAISKRANISALAVATIRKFGQLYTIDFKVIDPQTGDRLFSTKVEGNGQASIPGLLDRLSEKTRIDLKEQENIVQLTSPGVGEVTTTNLQAYQHYFQGEQLFNQSQFKKAEQEFRQAIAIDSTFALAHYRLAYVLDWWKGTGEEAIQEAMKYIDSVPEKEQYMIRAYFVKNAEDQAKAIELYKELLKLYPEEKEAIFIVGDLSFHEGDFSTAITYLERVLAIDPLSTRAWQHLCQALYFSEQYQRQLDAARQYKDKIQSLAAYRELGHAFSNNHDHKSAIQTFSEAAERFPDSSLPAVQIGGVYLLQENYRMAKVEFRKLLEKDRPLSHQGAGYKALVMLNAHMGHFQEVLRLCDRLIELETKRENTTGLAYAHVLKAFWLASGLNDLEGAREAIENGVAYQNDAAFPFYWVLCNAYIRIGEYERASDIEKEHLGSIVLSDRVLNGHKQKAAGNFEAAIRDFELISQNVGGPVGINSSHNLALLHFRLGQYELGIQAAQRALQIAPDINLEINWVSQRAEVFAKTFNLLGKIYEKKGDPKKAIQNTEKFLDLWKKADPDLPDLIDAKERLARLKAMTQKNNL